MGSYVFIESRDPFESRDTKFVAETASALKRQGNDVTVFLVQNGVFGVRSRAPRSHVTALTGAGIAILADDFSMRERGIAGSELASGVRTASIDSLVDLIAREGAKAIWH